jgi:hypothetical protein
MIMPRDFLLFVALATVAAMPALARTAMPAVSPAGAQRTPRSRTFRGYGVTHRFPGSSRRHRVPAR